MKEQYLAFLLFIAFFSFNVYAQKPYYNPKIAGWENENPNPDAQIEYSVFLLGDAGKPSTNPLEPTFQLLGKQMQAASEESAIIYLGDNLYPRGLTNQASPDRKGLEKYLTTQLDLLKDFKGKGFMIPGNHDWAQGRRIGLQHILNQGNFIEEYLGEGNGILFPQDGCPGPVEVELSENLVLILIDTQWWLHSNQKPDAESDCGAKTDDEFLIQLNDAVLRNYDKKIIVAGHHPMYSNGLHGGHAPIKNHLFPLTDFKDNLYVPLPILGSVYVGYRTLFGNIQDIPHPRYKALRDAMMNIFNEHENLMYVAGHDHSQQYIPKDKTHLIVSGSGSKKEYISKNPKANFAHAEKGFARLDFYKNGDAWLSFWEPDNSNDNEGKLAYRQKLFTFQPKDATNFKAEDFNSYGETVDTAAVDALKAKGLKSVMLGNNYRPEWNQTLKNVPVFDIGTEKGGLKIVQRGGGMQTRSLRLQAESGKQYALRSIEKFAEKAVPENLRGTVAQDVVEDQVSGSHPYGAIAVPKLAEAAGVYHTNPKLFFVTKDERMGQYAQNFIPGIYLFEERPAGKVWKDLPSFGNSKEILSTSKTLKKITKDNDDLIDQEHVLRSRIFDMWIGDWDRHDDQWRWASFKDKKKDIKFYRPIPRDRDQAFFWTDALVMKVGTRKWGQRKLQGFHKNLRDPAGLAFNARHFDRSFLTEPDWKMWQSYVDTIQTNLTDEVIEEAIHDFPPELYQHSGDTIVAKLKARRDKLETFAREFYLELAKNVSVLGSNKHEYFEVERLNDEETRVRVYKMKKDDQKKKHKMYDRTFLRSETKEIRLYGLGGEDKFEISGEVNSGIKVRVIGGDDKDEIIDNSKVRGMSKKTKVYDTKEGNTLALGTEGKNLTSNSVEINSYDRKSFVFDVTMPQISFNFNPDDGIFIGGGAQIIKHGFRKTPFKARHTIVGNFAPKTSSFNIEYNAEFIHIFGKWDLVFETDLRSPNFVDFFYGFGNETENRVEELGNRYNRVRYEQFLFNPTLRRLSKDLKHELNIGYAFQYISLGNTFSADRFIYQPESNINPDVLTDDHFFNGFFANYTFDGRDSRIIPKRGLRLHLGASRVSGTDEEQREEINYAQLKGDISVYLTPGRYSPITLASRLGGTVNFDDYEFFQANRLGGMTNLRGHRRMRFAGDQSVYWNNELRLRLFKFVTYLFPGEFGINAIYDRGRVWYENDEGIDPSVPSGDSDKWHEGYGGGIWFTPFQATVVAFDLTRSDDQDKWLPFLRFGFLF